MGACIKLYAQHRQRRAWLRRERGADQKVRGIEETAGLTAVHGA